MVASLVLYSYRRVKAAIRDAEERVYLNSGRMNHEKLKRDTEKKDSTEVLKEATRDYNNLDHCPLATEIDSGLVNLAMEYL